ncbi:MAG: hypothetical protein LBD22_04810 [Spirochaetaceae bacterium]|jgi:hypothetical protein|nr:hypothetical protein [Spirochaetaceae bacterium]
MNDMQPEEGFVFGSGSTFSSAESNVIGDEGGEDTGAGEDLSSADTRFPEITKLLEDKESQIFNDPAYYKNVFADAADSAKRLHTVFQKYLAAKDPSDKTLFRQQMTNAYWDHFSSIIKNPKFNEPQRYFLRFGMLYPGALSPESKTFFARIIVSNDLNEPIFYIDEWFRKIGRGDIKASASDEMQAGAKGNQNAHFKSLLEKSSGKFEGTRGLLRSKDVERTNLEKQILEKTTNMFAHTPCSEFPDIKSCYTEGQKAMFNDMQELLKSVHRIDREIGRLLEEYGQSKQDVQILEEKVAATNEAESQSIDLQALDTEYNSLRQMAKMTIGRQGNPFPVLTNDYFHSMADNVGFRENVIKKLAWVEEADCEAFIRLYKNHPSRIVPYVLLLPTYGDYGICWEPFDKLNKATSRGRIAIPMYPKNLTIAILTAVGDFRWQVAKEIASMYWMEEGLTGNYFQWFQGQKLKGDVKLYFIQDYIAWMTKEREGVQKLDKAVRGIFWRFLPFSQPLKDKLKDRNLVYQELYQRDKNRAKSDSY